MGKKAGSKKSAAPAAVPPPKPVHERGALWQAKKLTGNRAQKGSHRRVKRRFLTLNNVNNSSLTVTLNNVKYQT